MGRTLETIIKIAGDIDASLGKAIADATGKLDKMEAAVKAASSATDKLSFAIVDQENELERAKKAYMDYALAGEKNSKEAKALKKKIQQLSGELRSNKNRLSAAEEAANELAGELDDVGDAARDSKGGLSVMEVALGNLVANGVTALASKAADAVKSIYGLSESTREYREDMGKLETAWESAGRSTELATDIYKQFYSVLGEEDRSVEAVNHLAKFVETEKDMQKWTTIATGVWGTFGDSLPIEGLTEAANETAKVGEVTGVLADALNWAGVNQDDFQKYLDKCSNEQERAAYITEMLNELYGDAAKNYRENNESIIDARLAQSDYTDSLAEMGEKIEPVTTAVQEGLNKILTKALELADRVDFNALADKVGKLTDKAIVLAEDGFGWLQENADWLIPTITGLVSAFAAFKVIGGAIAMFGKLTKAASTVSKVIKTATTAGGALKGVLGLISGPVGWVALAIGALVAAGVALYKNWDTVKAKAIAFGDKVNQIWTGVSDWITGAIDKIGQYFPLFGGYLSGWWTSIQAAVKNVKGIFNGVIDFVSNVFSGNWSAAWDNVIQIFGNIFGMIGNLASAPLNGLIGLVNKAIDGINSIGIDLPDWLGGKSFSFNIPKIPEIPTFAAGGFTNGTSIAGEAGTEAVISFDPAYRAANLSYWAQAGRMLGADASDFALGGESGGTYYDVGGVTFAPNITVTGNADKGTIMEAIEAEYPEFMDMLDEYFARKGRAVYV